MAGKAFKRAVRKDPIWFSLPGEGDEEIRFDCVDTLPAGVIMDFGDMTEERGGNTIAAVRDLFDTAIIEEQHEKFWAMTRDKKNPIGIDMLIEVAEYIADVYTARPTGESSPSGQSTTSTGGGSTAGALHAVSTYSKPEPIAALT